MSTHFERGLALIEVRRWDLAEIEFRRILAETPDDAHAHGNLSLCLCNLKGRLNEALSEADEAVRLAPDDAFSHMRRGFALNLLRRVRVAEIEAREAIRLDPTDIGGYQLLSNVWNQLGFSLRALDAADRGLAICPNDVCCLTERSIALQNLGRMNAFHETTDFALALTPETANTHASLGWQRVDVRDFSRARDHFLEALRIEPENEWARQGLAYARFPLLRGYHRLKAWIIAVFVDPWR